MRCNKMKRVFALILCLAVVLALALPAAAAQQSPFLHPFLRVEEDSLLLAGGPTEGTAPSITVNGQSFSQFSVSTVQEEELPITYYCLVDQSSSFSISQKKQQLEALNALSSALRPMDRMVLVTMRDKLSFGEPLGSSDALEKAITEACTYTAPQTYLSDAVVKAIETVSKTQDDQSVCCIVLFSDGLDDTVQKKSQEEINALIRSSGLSLNVVALVDPWADQYGRGLATQLVCYAEPSLGGIGTAPLLNGEAGKIQDGITEIVNAMLSGSVLRLDAMELPRDKDSVTIEAALSQSQAGTIRLETSILPELPQPTEPETTAPPTTEPTTMPTTAATTAPTQPASLLSGQGGANLLLVLILVGAALVLILVVVMVVLMRRRREDHEEEDEYDGEEFMAELETPKAPPANIKLDFSDFEKPEEPTIQEPFLPELTLPKQTASGCIVHLVPENHPEGAVKFIIKPNASVTLGRNSKSDIVLNETDNALSGLHFELQWDSRTLYLRDRNSTNGTALNGVPLRADVWARVENKAVIQAGSTRYAVIIRKK